MKKLLLAVLGVAACSLLAPALAADKELPLPTDQKFLVKAIECTIAEVKLADTAQTRAFSPDVKQLAKTIRDEHKTCLDKLMAEAKNEKLAVVEGLDKEHRELVDRLSRLEGKPFDQEYVKGVIERHQKAIQMCETQIKDGKDQEITAFCREALPKMKAHLEEARKVQEKIK